MKLQVNQEELRDVLAMLVLCSTDEHVHRPILSQLKFVTAKEDKLIIYASDSEVSMALTIKAEIEGHGEFTLPAKELFQLVKSFTKEKPVTFEFSDGGRIKVKQGRSVYKLVGMGLESFPEVKYFKSEAYMPINPKMLLEAIETVSYACWTDDTRPALTGVFLEPADNDGFARAIACDGRRLAVFRMPAVLTSSVILNKKSVAILSKVLGKQEEVGLMVDGNQAYFCLDKGVFNARLVEHEYPNVKKVLPTGACSLLNINREDTIKAVKRLLAFSGEHKKFQLVAHEGTLTLSAKDDIADSIEELTLLEGSDLKSRIEIAFNGTYLLHAIERLKEDSMTVRIYGPILPLIISEKNITQVIMPVKV